MPTKLSPQFEERLRRAVRGVSGVDPVNFMYRAEAILRLSDFFNARPSRPTPWSDSGVKLAYLDYFLPLNYVRLYSAFREIGRFLGGRTFSEIWDFGSGPGTTQWVLEDIPGIEPVDLHCVEISAEARDLHVNLAMEGPCRWNATFPTAIGRPAPGALAVFCYAFLEMAQSPPDLEVFDHILILEPSTRDRARALQEKRAWLHNKGFHLLAPCTHERDCPLLLHSERDWCHTRVAFEPPEHLRHLEAHLPMHNRTLTYSYLLASRSVENVAHRTPAARVIGDTLRERGKTRQMICRGTEREFLSWLHRHGEPPRIPRGALVNGVERCKTKGSELRVEPDTRLNWII